MITGWHYELLIIKAILCIKKPFQIKSQQISVYKRIWAQVYTHACTHAHKKASYLVR